MLHPDGLECDIFVTHCWLEGIYECIDKVLNSWPRRARHAYCCMLSNPQNLDIGDLLSSPRESPFAHALMSARYVLVVPNHKCSIYSRIWCVYEAFIAYSESKFIFIATHPLKGVWTRGVLLLALSLLAASGSGALFAQVEVNEFGILVGGTIGDMPTLLLPAVLELPPLVCMVLHSCLRPSRAMQVLAHATAVFCGVNAGCLCYIAAVLVARNGLYGNFTSVYVGLALRSLGLCVAAALAEADRLWGLQSMEEATQLRWHFTGELRDAQSSVDSDKEKILRELEASGQEQHVNRAIDVLLASGVSTPTLQAAAERAGVLEQAGYWNLGIVSVIWVMWASESLLGIFIKLEEYWVLVTLFEKTTQENSKWAKFFMKGLCMCLPMEDLADKCKAEPGCIVGAECTIDHTRLVENDLDPVLFSMHCDPVEPPMEPIANWHVWVLALADLQALVWLIRFRCQGQDTRGFAASAMVKLIGTFLIPMVVVTVIIGSVLDGSPRFEPTIDAHLDVSMVVQHLVLEPLVLMLCFVGPGCTAKVPVFGRHIVRCLMSHMSCGRLHGAKARKNELEAAQPAIGAERIGAGGDSV